MHKKYFIIIFLILISFFVINPVIIAQRNLRYKDVYKAVVEKSREEAYSILLIYQKQDPYFPNPYFQLGLIAKYWSKDYDALTDIKDVNFFIYNTNLYFGLAKAKIDEKEIRKNDDYYKNASSFNELEKLNFEDVKSYINEQIAANNEYKRNVEIVTNYYNSSIDHYNYCIKVFKEINQDNLKIKDIYMTADEEFIKKLDDLENSFDSTIYYLQNYQTAIKNYPIKEHNQKYQLYPIETYRLQGLTSSDFLKDKIHLWDYGTWVKDFKLILNTDIKQLRGDVGRANKDLDKHLKSITNSNKYKTDFKKYKVDEKLINRIGKYDYNSLLVSLFRYKEAKQEFLAKSKDPVNDALDTSNIFSMFQKAKFYDDLVKSKNLADSMNADFQIRINSYDVNKYKQFFKDNYSGETGLKNYTQTESAFLNSELDSAFYNFRNYLLRDMLHENKIVTLPYRKNNIELKIVNQLFTEAKPGKFHITAYSKDNSGNYYATGFIKQRNPGVSAFVLKTTKLDNIEWLKVYPIGKTSNDFGSFIQATENGCELLVTSIRGPEIKNHVFRMGLDGKQASKKEVKTGLIPRYFNYDEINENYLIAFKGLNVNEFENLSDNLIINEYDGTTLTVKWSTVLNLKGSLVNIIKMNESFFVFTNFTKFASGSNIISSKAGVQNTETNSLLFILNNFGEVQKTVPYLSESSFFIAKAIKINSNTINMVGFNQPLISTRTAVKEDFAKPVYLLVNTNGEIYYDNRKN
ncbi:MAG: hypothetical protein ABFS35_01665 [Bacteroidota bacterium]